MGVATIALVTSGFTCVTAAIHLGSSCLSDPIARWYTVFVNRQKGLKTLESEMQKLQKLREDVEGKYVDKVLDKSSKVSQWLEKVKEFDDRDADGKKLGDIIKESNLVGLIYGKSQHKAGKRIVEKNAELDALKLEGNDYIIEDESNVLGHKKGISIDELVGKAEEKANVIQKHVAGQEYRTILVYGMAGCGKTAIVSAVNDMLLSEYSGNGGSTEDQPFNKIIWVTVENKGSDQSSIEDLQDKIAAKLSIDLKSSSVSRAETLRSALSGKRFLIILDNMLNKNISLKKIGVPYLSKENGCKVIIVSRSYAMSSDCKVEIEPLSDQEAQDLFQRKAGMELSILTEDARATAETMIEECEGLPSGIVTLVETLKALKKGGDNDSDSGAAAWRTAFDELKTSSDDLNAMNEKAFKRLQDGYDMLKKDAKQCFLYCALYPSGYLIEKKELVEYWFCEGLLDGGRRTGEIEDIPRAKEIIKELKRAHLVKIVGEQQIKMCNLAWKMAVHLTSPDQFLINSGEQNRCRLLLEEDTNVPQVMRASLMMSKIKKIMEEPKFSKLSTLLLQKSPITQVHKYFFDNMPNLKVLDLSQTKISTLPNLAFSKLKKLRALLVRNCPALKSLPSLADCEELLLLDLSDTPIKHLPDGMEKLTKLIRLNLSRTNVGEFGAEVACALENLGELFMITNVDSAAGFLGGISETGASNIEEWYQPLPNLYILHIKFLDAETFDSYVVSQTHDLSKFKFCVAGGTDETTSPDNSTVSIQGKFFVNKKPVSLPDKTSELHVSRNSDLPCLRLPASPLKCLKVINISYCTSLVYLFKRDVVYELPNLETISVEKCPRMKALVESTGDGGEELPLQLHPDLKRLKFINISDCENLVYVFRTEMVEHLSNLQKISISRRQVEKNNESKEPKESKNLVLVDPLELNTKYEGAGNNNEPEKEIWSFAKLKIEITTSPQDNKGGLLDVSPAVQ